MAVYHSIVYPVLGSIAGFAGDGSLTAKIHETDSGEHLYTVTAVAGDYAVDVYDNTRDHFTHVREDATHVGRSENWKAT
jgi:hypothetical protein